MTLRLQKMERDDFEIVVLSPRVEVGKNKMRRLTEEEMAKYIARKKVNASRDESLLIENGQMDGQMDGLANTSSSEKPT